MKMMSHDPLVQMAYSVYKTEKYFLKNGTIFNRLAFHDKQALGILVPKIRIGRLVLPQTNSFSKFKNNTTTEFWRTYAGRPLQLFSLQF